jgi:hypothetical protein
MVLADPIAPRDREPQEAVAMTTTPRITTGLVVALALATAAAPASARTFELNTNGSYVTTPPPSTHADSPATIVVATAHDGGFDWGDAGIGAAGGLGLTIVAVGGALTVSQRRTRRRPA